MANIMASSLLLRSSSGKLQQLCGQSGHLVPDATTMANLLQHPAQPRHRQTRGNMASSPSRALDTLATRVSDLPHTPPAHWTHRHTGYGAYITLSAAGAAGRYATSRQPIRAQISPIYPYPRYPQSKGGLTALSEPLRGMCIFRHSGQWVLREGGV